MTAVVNVSAIDMNRSSKNGGETPPISTYQRIEDYENTQVMTKQALQSKVKLDEDRMPSGSS